MSALPKNTKYSPGEWVLILVADKESVYKITGFSVTQMGEGPVQIKYWTEGGKSFLEEAIVKKVTV